MPCRQRPNVAQSLAVTMLTLAFRTVVRHVDEYRALPAGRREELFEELLAGAGFAVERVPLAQLHEEYRDGEYRVLRATKRDVDPG